MAKKRFLVIADSFIHMRLIKADMPVKQRIVEIETDPELGGMRPGSNLVECDEDGNPIAAGNKAAKARRTAASHNDGTGAAGAAPANKDGGAGAPSGADGLA